jgi:hypothetical protein
MHGIYVLRICVDDMADTSTSTKMLNQFLKLYAEDFDYTRGG